MYTPFHHYLWRHDALLSVPASVPSLLLCSISFQLSRPKVEGEQRSQDRDAERQDRLELAFTLSPCSAKYFSTSSCFVLEPITQETELERNIERKRQKEKGRDSTSLLYLLHDAAHHVYLFSYSCVYLLFHQRRCSSPFICSRERQRAVINSLKHPPNPSCLLLALFPPSLVSLSLFPHSYLSLKPCSPAVPEWSFWLLCILSIKSD